MVTVISEHQAFGGQVKYCRHTAESTGCDMQFAVYIPPQAKNGRVPVLYYLAGLTCNEETFMIKSGAQRFAAQHGIMLVAPDTSPRGDGVADDSAWDLGCGAGFYLDASESPWQSHYKMYTYISRELPGVLSANFPADVDRQGIFGHSMGGHGALIIALKNPDQYKTVSAFAPIAAPMQCPWGQKAFSHYLGNDKSQWEQYDAAVLMSRLQDGRQYPQMLIDQGLADTFLDEQLYPESLEAAAQQVNYPLHLRRHESYDHGYYFIASFIEDHINHHALGLIG